ncbi:MAG: hypothetical protein ACRDIV_23685, partial [Ktedonobacteraceae bacterium]
MGGDACVALGCGAFQTREQDAGDASVPSLPNPTPRPYGMTPILRLAPLHEQTIMEHTTQKKLRIGVLALQGDFE